MNQRSKREGGSVVTEASIVLPLFIIAVYLIINLVNIFSLHNKVQFGINAVAHEMASCLYLDSALHIHQTVEGISSDGDNYTKPIDDTSNDILEFLDSIQALKNDAQKTVSQVAQPDLSKQGIDDMKAQTDQVKQDISDTRDKAQTAVDDVKNLAENPKETAIGAGYIGIDALINWVRDKSGSFAAKNLIGQYLGDEYLRVHSVQEGLAGLDFTESSIFNDEDSRMVDIVVKYDVNLKFFKLVLGAGEPKLTIVQRVTVPAWLDGDGQTPPSK